MWLCRSLKTILMRFLTIIQDLRRWRPRLRKKRNKMRNEFNFFVEADIPDDIYKAATEAKGNKRYDNMIIEGLASDSSRDSEGETMEPNGFEIDEFLKSGLVNLEHLTSRKGDPDFWIGEPISGYVKDNKFFVKAKLWKAK